MGVTWYDHLTRLTFHFVKGPVWFLLFPVILEFIKIIVRFALILPAILDIQSSLLSINMCNGFFHVKNVFRFKFNQYIYILYW
jgi:hypothetical protein